MCQLCVGRISIFFVRWGKNKKHSVGQRVGLDAVQLQSDLYVFGHLSKWFVFVLMFKFWSVSCLWNGRPTIGYNNSLPETQFRVLLVFGDMRNLSFACDSIFDLKGREFRVYLPCAR